MPTVSSASPALPGTRSTLAGFAATLPGRLVFGLVATVIVALAAHIAIPLPFTPVPFIMTPLAVLGVGLAFGPVGGFLVMLTYLAEGACGLPVFSPTGPGGVLQILGPTGGFLLAYPLVAAIVGGLTRLLAPRMPRFAAATVAGLAAITVLFTVGALWFHQLTHLPLNLTLTETVYPFLPGEAVKILAAAGIYSTLLRARRA